MVQTNINQLQLLQQNLNNLSLQKQQFQQQEIELNSALKELPTSSQSFQIVGKLMISKNKGDLVKDLEQKKEMTKLRINNIEKQEEKIKDSIKEVQEKVMSDLKKE